MQLEGVEPNYFTFSTVLGTCGSLASLPVGKAIHRTAIDCRYDSHVVVGTALIDMYGKCGIVEGARKVFNNVHLKNVVSWTAMISVYVQYGHGKEALMLFTQMHQEGLKANKFTVSMILGACFGVTTLKQGRNIHDVGGQSGLDSGIMIETALINMYSKCGSLENAQRVFDRMQQCDLVAWNAMLASYAQYGRGKKVLELFRDMELEDVRPDHVSFLNVFSACSRAGLVDEGWCYFLSMTESYALKPRVEHYTNMIDMLGRAGRLEEAEDFITKLPLQADVAVWSALLGACKVHGDVHRGKRAAEHIIQLDPENAAPYLMLLQIHAAYLGSASTPE